MCEENKIQAFNEKCYENLKNIMEELGDLCEEPRIYCLSFDVDGSKITPIITEDQNINNHSENFLAYYWAEFVHNGIPHKLSMFIKAFDRRTGNLQILPGVPELWKADIDAEHTDNGHFIIYEGRSCDWKPGFPKPYSDHKGGKLYCEKVDGKLWVPLLEKENEKENITVSKFFYSPESNISLESLDEKNKIYGTFTEKITDEERKQYKELNKELNKSLYIDGKVYSGPAVLNFTQWQYLKNKKDKKGILKKEDPKFFRYLCKPVHCKGYGYFFVYGDKDKVQTTYKYKDNIPEEEYNKLAYMKSKEDIDGNIKAGPNYFDYDNYHWVLSPEIV